MSHDPQPHAPIDAVDLALEAEATAEAARERDAQTELHNERTRADAERVPVIVTAETDAVLRRRLCDDRPE